MRYALPAALAACLIFAAAGCSGGGSAPPPPPPQQTVAKPLNIVIGLRDSVPDPLPETIGNLYIYGYAGAFRSQISPVAVVVNPSRADFPISRSATIEVPTNTTHVCVSANANLSDGGTLSNYEFFPVTAEPQTLNCRVDIGYSPPIIIP